jgi:hypothetical protein
MSPNRVQRASSVDVDGHDWHRGSFLTGSRPRLHGELSKKLDAVCFLERLNMKELVQESFCEIWHDDASGSRPGCKLNDSTRPVGTSDAPTACPGRPARWSRYNHVKHVGRLLPQPLAFWPRQRGVVGP